MKYFKPSEFYESPTAKELGINNMPDTFESYFNVFLVAFYLSHIRSVYGSPITVTSGYRSCKLNHAVGGVNTSKHLHGLAVDISILHTADYGNFMSCN